MPLIPFASRLNPRLCLPCLLPAAVFLAASLTPSLIPRPMLLQAVLSGLSFAVGYGLGAGWIALWRYLGLPALSGRVARTAGIIAGVICVLLVGVSSIRSNQGIILKKI